MRYPPDQKEKTRRAILEAAARVFRRQGYQGGGVDAVMKEAGLTHGGFYSHFANKEALLADSVLDAMSAMRERHEGWTGERSGGDWLRAFLGGYLSPEHRSHPEQGCVVPTLVSELGRAGEGPREHFEKGLREWADRTSGHLGTTAKPDDADAALGILSACIGGLAMARAVADEELADRILQSTRDMVERAFAEPSSTSVREDRPTASGVGESTGSPS